MPEQDYYLGGPVLWNNLSRFRDRCNQILGRLAVVAVGGDGLLRAIALTDIELVKLREVNSHYEILDSWEPSKLRNLTLTQINNRIDAVQTQIDAVTNVATAKIALNSMHVDMQKMARIILWLLKREQSEL